LLLEKASASIVCISPWLACSQHGDPPLISAIANGHVEVARLLLEHKADANQANTKVTMHKS
jgi:ankyrin repeat protein